MTKTFKEVSKVETVDFCSLAAGDCFCFGNTYYMKLIMDYEFDNDGFSYNSIDLEKRCFDFFLLEDKSKTI